MSKLFFRPIEISQDAVTFRFIVAKTPASIKSAITLCGFKQAASENSRTVTGILIRIFRFSGPSLDVNETILFCRTVGAALRRDFFRTKASRRKASYNDQAEANCCEVLTQREHNHHPLGEGRSVITLSTALCGLCAFPVFSV